MDTDFINKTGTLCVCVDKYEGRDFIRFLLQGVKRIRTWMKREGIEDWRFRLEWVSAGEGKRWQNIMTEMSEELMAKKETIKPPIKAKEEAV